MEVKDVFILYHGIMNTSNGEIINTVCYNFSFNTEVLQSVNAEYNPFKCNYITRQDKIKLVFYNGDLIESYYEIILFSGSVKIINCYIQQISVAIHSYMSDEFIIKHSTINNGKYYGSFHSDHNFVHPLILQCSNSFISSKTTHFHVLIQMVL